MASKTFKIKASGTGAFGDNPVEEVHISTPQ